MVQKEVMGKDKPSDFQVTDRRFWVVDESAVDAATVPSPRYPTVVEQLKARTETAEQKLRVKIEELEEENRAFRKRLDTQLEQRVEEQVMQLLESLLEVADNLERALAALGPEDMSSEGQSGLLSNLRLFERKLADCGVDKMDLLGKTFDPEEAEAVGVRPVREPEQDHTVVEIVRQGYRYGGKVLRPAMVHVGRFQRDPS